MARGVELYEYGLFSIYYMRLNQFSKRPANSSSLSIFVACTRIIIVVFADHKSGC